MEVEDVGGLAVGMVVVVVVMSGMVRLGLEVGRGLPVVVAGVAGAGGAVAGGVSRLVAFLRGRKTRVRNLAGRGRGGDRRVVGVRVCGWANVLVLGDGGRRQRGSRF